MKIYVCVKHVPDSAATITIRDTNRIEENITFLMNPYDEHAVTEAARLRARIPGAEVIAVCVAGPAAENTLRSAMAMGADRSILVCADRPVDSMLTARALAAAIQQDGAPGLILGRKRIHRRRGHADPVPPGPPSRRAGGDPRGEDLPRSGRRRRGE